VFDARRARDNVTGADNLHRLAFLLGEPHTRGYNQPLTCRMRMPGGTSAGFKRDISPGNRDVVIRSEERINPDATGKVLGGPIYRVLTSCGGDMDSGILLRCPG
jgi:hypothetical protein